MREALGILDPSTFPVPVWAHSGDIAPIGSFTDGYSDIYNGSVFPDRRHLNHVLAYATAVAGDVNKGGAGLPWDAGIKYEVGAQVFYGGTLYICILNTDLNQSPDLPLYWSTLGKFLGIDALKTDTKYIPFTGHSLHALTISSSATNSYNRGGFIGNGLVHSDIRSIHLLLRNDHSTQVRKLYCSLPDTAEDKLIMAAVGTNSKDRAHQYGIMQIPMNSDTSFIKLTMISGNSGFKCTVLGATQRV